MTNNQNAEMASEREWVRVAVVSLEAVPLVYGFAAHRNYEDAKILAIRDAEPFLPKVPFQVVTVDHARFERFMAGDVLAADLVRPVSFHLVWMDPDNFGGEPTILKICPVKVIGERVHAGVDPQKILADYPSLTMEAIIQASTFWTLTKGRQQSTSA